MSSMAETSRSPESSFSRRSLLRSAAVLGARALAGPALGGALLAGCKKPVLATVVERHKAVVIGSGFGGAVAALRLAQAGIETLVLERGRRWPIRPDGNTFPSFNRPDRRASFLKSTTVFPGAPFAVFKPYAGLFEVVEGRGMDVVVGAGVGGSSLVYGGMMLKPRRDLFYRSLPAEIDYDEMDRVYYPRVKSMLGLSPIPDDVLAHERYHATRVFFDHAARAGLTGVRIDDAVDWGVIRDELAGKAVASATRGDLIYGINSGAKNSVDRNYLPAAEATGRVKVYPLHVVQDVSEVEPGRYSVTCEEITEDGDPVVRRVVICDYLFFAAGSMGTSKMLVKAKGAGALPRLNDHVGKHWGNNGDRLLTRFGLRQGTGSHQGTPAAAAIYHWDNPKGPTTIEFGPAPFLSELWMMAVLGMGIPEKEGQFVFDPGSGSVRLEWPSGGDAGAVRAIKHTLDVLNKANGGFTYDMNSLGRNFTFHPLGGAVLGKACDGFGRLRNHHRLYVVDASLIPGSTGCCNPAWTVAALAERCMDRILEEDFPKKGHAPAHVPAHAGGH